MDWVLMCLKNSAKYKYFTIFAPLNPWTTKNGKRRGKEKNREKNLTFQQQTGVMIYLFLPPSMNRGKKKKRKWLLTRLKRHGLDSSLTLSSLNADFVDFLDFIKVTWRVKGGGRGLGRNRFFLLWKPCLYHQMYYFIYFTSLVFQLCFVDTFFFIHLVKGWHRVIKNRKPSKK